MRSAKETVLAAGAEMFGNRDASAVDAWVSPTYVQHSAMAADGPEGLRQVIARLGDGFRYEPHRALGDGDLVALHGTYYGFGPDPMVAFDVFRVADGRLAEHWDALQPRSGSTVSGRTETDGPTEVTDLDRTEENRVLVTTFVEEVLRGGRTDALSEYISTARYDQHNPLIGDGVEGLAAGLAAFAEQGVDMVYETLHLVVAEGNFVLTVCEGRIGATPTAFYDLFRVEEGRIVEHWDVTPAIPDANLVPHDNGPF
ncbi:nuclear transport factor 2 family protein [Streptomyces sp. NPDC047928]|uniref:nuclear transport factor 2 family protein n=1 Tax=unclassified Streptomyces TaxID=2593676 RepID=UPI00371A05BC